jgi:hypothetical protein
VGEKINAWKTMVKDNLFVETEGMNYSQIMCRSHPYGEQSQMGYASYPLGFATVKRIREAIIKEGTPKELLRYGDAMRAIMKEGALADQTTLSGQIPK